MHIRGKKMIHNFIVSRLTAEFIEESIARTNEFFGGLNPHVYRAFLTHGEMDPRRHLGPSADINPQSPVVVMSRKFAKICEN